MRWGVTQMRLRRRRRRRRRQRLSFMRVHSCAHTRPASPYARSTCRADRAVLQPIVKAILALFWVMDPNQGCDPISCNRCSNHQVGAVITAVTACNQGYMRADGAGRRADHAVFPPGIRSAAEIMEAYSGPVPLYKQVHTSPSTSRYTRPPLQAGTHACTSRSSNACRQSLLEMLRPSSRVRPSSFFQRSETSLGTRDLSLSGHVT